MGSMPGDKGDDAAWDRFAGTHLHMCRPSSCKQRGDWVSASPFTGKDRGPATESGGSEPCWTPALRSLGFSADGTLFPRTAPLKSERRCGVMVMAALRDGWFPASLMSDGDWLRNLPSSLLGRACCGALSQTGVCHVSPELTLEASHSRTVVLELFRSQNPLGTSHWL